MSGSRVFRFMAVPSVLLFVAGLGCSGTGGTQDPGDGGDAGKEVADPGTDVVDVPSDHGPTDVPVVDDVPAKDLPIDAPPDLVDAQEVTPPVPCDDADGCPDGLGCVEKVCGPCTDASQCRETEGCVDGICGPCETNANCPEGLVCRESTKTCDTCRVADECDPGQACLEDETCGPCATGPECDGWLCVDGACEECVPVTDNGLCEKQFDDPGDTIEKNWECDESGNCTPTVCEDGSWCYVLGWVCSQEGFCVPCDVASDCTAPDTGEYPTGTACIKGHCVIEDPCEDHKDCPKSMPVCDEDTHSCRKCDVEGECTGVLKYLQQIPEDGSGICTEGGRCVPGVCGGLFEVNCTGGLLCDDKHLCLGCTDKEDDVACAQAYTDDHGCFDGICQKGECHEQACCPLIGKPGTVLVGYWCMDCEPLPDSDASCNDMYGSETIPFLCHENTCIPGECHDHLDCDIKYSGEQRVCGPDLFCHSCNTIGGTQQEHDAICKDKMSDLHWICDWDTDDERYECMYGCAFGQGTCPDGLLCQQDYHCQPCQTEVEDTKCASDYGEKRLCEGGKCIPGECRHYLSNNWCEINQNGKTCVDYFCEPCGNMALCPSGMVCTGGQCVTGECCVDANCTPIKACGGSLACGVNHQCEGCVVGSDCYEGYDCLNKSGACDPVTKKCKPITELEVMPNKCFIQGVCRDAGVKFDPDDPDAECLLCHPDVASGGDQKAWTPGSWNPITGFDPTDCYIESTCYPKTTQDTSLFGSYECRWCDPDPGNRDTLFNWSSRPDPSPDIADRFPCSQPLFWVPDPNDLGQVIQSGTPAYSGSIDPNDSFNDFGYCWEGECLGLSWTPWLPVGPSAAGGPYDLNLNSTPMKLFGSFGGGFGAGIPNANIGCGSTSSCEICPFLDSCVEE